MPMRSTSIQKQRKAVCDRVFWTLAISLVIFIPFVIMDGGYFIYLGDFNCQQIPFYIEVNESIRNGEFFWNWNTDLGANLIGSYAFLSDRQPLFLADAAPCR